MDKKIYLKARVIDWALVGAILTGISIIVSIVGISISTIDNRYNVSSLGDAVEINMKYTKSTPQATAVSIEPCKGYVKWGFKQTKGPTKTRYNAYYRKVSSSTYTLDNKYIASKNKRWYGEYTLVKSNGYTDYVFKLTRVNNTSKTTKLVADLFVD